MTNSKWAPPQIQSTWGAKLDIKCEHDPRRGVILRTKRSNDKQLRKCPTVRVCAVLKDGVRFTTPKLNELGKAILDVKMRYEEQQTELVAKAVEIARTYLPVVEGANALLAELDAYNGCVVVASLTAALVVVTTLTLCVCVCPFSMACAAATAPNDYCKPRLAPAGVGDTVIHGGRHPVLEVQDNMSFIPNDFKYGHTAPRQFSAVAGVSLALRVVPRTVVVIHSMLRETARFHIITGPNMGGKSTHIRQVCFTPAVSRVVCRCARVTGSAHFPVLATARHVDCHGADGLFLAC